MRTPRAREICSFGEIEDWRMHEECYHAADEQDLDGGFVPGSQERPKKVML